MNFHRCEIEEHGWGSVSSSDVDYMWAPTAEVARQQYCKKYGFRKNKKGLVVTQIQYKQAERIAKQQQELVTEKQIVYLGSYQYQSWQYVTRYFCSNCGKKVTSLQHYCTACDAELVDRV